MTAVPHQACTFLTHQEVYSYEGKVLIIVDVLLFENVQQTNDKKECMCHYFLYI